MRELERRIPHHHAFPESSARTLIRRRLHGSHSYHHGVNVPDISRPTASSPATLWVYDLLLSSGGANALPTTLPNAQDAPGDGDVVSIWTDLNAAGHRALALYAQRTGQVFAAMLLTFTSDDPEAFTLAVAHPEAVASR